MCTRVTALRIDRFERLTTNAERRTYHNVQYLADEFLEYGDCGKHTQDQTQKHHHEPTNRQRAI